MAAAATAAGPATVVVSPEGRELVATFHTACRAALADKTGTPIASWHAHVLGNETPKAAPPPTAAVGAPGGGHRNPPPPRRMTGDGDLRWDATHFESHPDVKPLVVGGRLKTDAVIQLHAELCAAQRASGRAPAWAGRLDLILQMDSRWYAPHALLEGAELRGIFCGGALCDVVADDGDDDKGTAAAAAGQTTTPAGSPPQKTKRVLADPGEIGLTLAFRVFDADRDDGVPVITRGRCNVREVWLRDVAGPDATMRLFCKSRAGRDGVASLFVESLDGAAKLEAAAAALDLRLVCWVSSRRVDGTDNMQGRSGADMVLQFDAPTPQPVVVTITGFWASSVEEDRALAAGTTNGEWADVAAWATRVAKVNGWARLDEIAGGVDEWLAGKAPLLAFVQ